MVRRKSRLKSHLRLRGRVRPVGFWKIEKTGSLPPSELLDQLTMRPLDYRKYARTKNGGR
jgi:hypothetical protein